MKLWALLRRSPAGVRFRRQHPIGPYVADFYCPTAKLVIEIDGMVHDTAEAAARDRERDEFMRGLGLAIVRIAAREVLANPAAAAESLIALCGPSTTQLR